MSEVGKVDAHDETPEVAASLDEGSNEDKVAVPENVPKD